MDDSQSSFAATLSAAQRGDECAVAVLWRDLNPRLLRFLRQRHRDGHEDVASDTWLRVSRGLHAFVGDEVEFRAWFFTIARATSVDAIRRAARRPSTSVDPTALDDHVAPDDPAAEALERLDTDAALALLGRLPAAQAEVVLLRVVAGLDSEHVGAIVGKRPGTVRVLQHRGLQRLAELLESARTQPRDVTR